VSNFWVCFRIYICIDYTTYYCVRWWCSLLAAVVRAGEMIFTMPVYTVPFPSTSSGKRIQNLPTVYSEHSHPPMVWLWSRSNWAVARGTKQNLVFRRPGTFGTGIWNWKPRQSQPDDSQWTSTSDVGLLPTTTRGAFWQGLYKDDIPVTRLGLPSPPLPFLVFYSLSPQQAWACACVATRSLSIIAAWGWLGCNLLQQWYMENVRVATRSRGLVAPSRPSALGDA